MDFADVIPKELETRVRCPLFLNRILNSGVEVPFGTWYLVLSNCSLVVLILRSLSDFTSIASSISLFRFLPSTELVKTNGAQGTNCSSLWSLLITYSLLKESLSSKTSHLLTAIIKPRLASLTIPRILWSMPVASSLASIKTTQTSACCTARRLLITLNFSKPCFTFPGRRIPVRHPTQRLVARPWRIAAAGLAGAVCRRRGEFLRYRAVLYSCCGI